MSLTLSGGYAAGTGVAAFGGAIYSTNSSLTLTDTLLSGNTANEGGGIFSFDNAATRGTLTLNNSAILNNTATAINGGVVVNSGAGIDVTFGNSIVAGNSGSPGADIRHLNGTILSAGFNLVGDNDTVSTEFPAGSPNVNDDLVGVPALLAPLGDYGGPTMTVLPLYGSPVVDAVAGSTLAADQRGVPRPQGSDSDIGALEVVDSDGDGLGDEYENLFTGTSAFNVGSDSDGLVDGAGGVVTTAAYPGGIDIDGDNFVDGELDLGTDPAISNLGDLAPRNNPDNLIDLGDLLVLTRLVTGAAMPSDLEKILGDINGDTLLNAPDILLLQQAIMNGTAP